MNPNDLVTISSDSAIAIRGCSYIYAPAGQAGEFSPLATNPNHGGGRMPLTKPSVKLTPSPNLEPFFNDLRSRLDKRGRRIEAGLHARLLKSRSELGDVIREYQKLCTPCGLFTAFLKAIGIPKKTAYRMMEDADSIRDLPSSVLKAAQDKNVDLAKRKYRPAVKALLLQKQGDDVEPNQQQAEEIISKIVTFKKPPEAARPARLSLEEFANREVRSFQAQYDGIPPDVRDKELRYIFELISATFRSEVTQLTRYGRPTQVPKPAAEKERIA
jgi:hypothetical protein